MFRSSPFFYAVVAGFLCAGLLPGQILIDTVAGGTPRSGVPASDVALGSIGGVTKDGAGNIVFCEDHVIRRVRTDGTIETIGGTGVSAFGGDQGPAAAALLYFPASPRFDANGNLFFIDRDNFRIRRITSTGIITTVAGTGIYGTLGEDGPAMAAQIDPSIYLAVDGSGNVYFTSRSNQIKRISPAGAISIYAGVAQVGNNSDGDGGPAVNANIRFPGALSFDGNGNLYIAESTRIRRVSPDGTITKFAGYGTSAAGSGDGGQALNATFVSVNGLAADSAGNIYVTDLFPTGGARIRYISPDGVINTVAGVSAGSTADGPASQSHLGSASSLFADGTGDVFFADGARVRVLTSQNTIETIAGGAPLAAPDGIAARDSWFVNPFAMAVAHNGVLYISEASNCTIRRVGSDGLLSTLAGTGKCSTTAPAGAAATTDLTAASGLAVDSKSRIYVADGSIGPVGATFLDNANIYVIDPSGTISTVPGSPFPPGPSARLAVDSQDRLYILTNTNVLRVTPGSAPAVFLPALPPGPDFFSAIGIGPSDTVNLMDVRNNQVLTFSQGGKNSSGFPTRSTPLAIASDAVGNLWEASTLGLAEATPQLLRDVNPLSGAGFFGDGGAFASARVSSVTGLAFAPNGDLYILDTGNRKVRKTSGAAPKNPPSIAAGGIVNALTLTGVSLAPGELISIFGSNLGPAALQVYSPDNNTVPAAVGGVVVYFNEYPGRITAVNASQINVFVPYEVVDSTSVQVIVDIDGVRSAPVTLSVSSSAFGLATADSSGHGQAAILNQDGSYNNKTTPAPSGSVVTLFGTGEGLTMPALPDGALVISTPFSVPVAPVTVSIGGQAASVLYAGAAPSLPTGVLQINVRIPDSTAPGDIPIVVSIGGIVSGQRVTCAVR